MVRETNNSGLCVIDALSCKNREILSLSRKQANIAGRKREPLGHTSRARKRLGASEYCTICRQEPRRRGGSAAALPGVPSHRPQHRPAGPAPAGSCSPGTTSPGVPCPEPSRAETSRDRQAGGRGRHGAAGLPAGRARGAARYGSARPGVQRRGPGEERRRRRGPRWARGAAAGAGEMAAGR